MTDSDHDTFLASSMRVLDDSAACLAYLQESAASFRPVEEMD